MILAGGNWGILQSTFSLQAQEHAQEKVLAPAIAVHSITIQPKTIPATLELSVTIQAFDQATLSTRVMGRITQLLLEEGAHFRKGSMLARVDLMDMTAQTVQARLGFAQSQAELARSQATLSQLQSQRVEAQASLRLARINQQRTAKLRAQGAVSQSQLGQGTGELQKNAHPLSGEMDAVTIAIAKRPKVNAIWVSHQVLRNLEQIKRNYIPRNIHLTVTLLGL